MSILIDHPIENKLDLIFIDPRNVMKGNAELTVQTMDNQVIKINTLKGLILRNVLRDNNIEIYTGKNKIGW
jgi:molybdopterin-binding protein